MVGTDKRIWVGVTKDTKSTTVLGDDEFHYIDNDGTETAKIKSFNDESEFTSDEVFVKWDDGEPNNELELNVELKKRDGNYILNDIWGKYSDIVLAFCEERNQDCFKGISFVICAFCQAFNLIYFSFEFLLFVSFRYFSHLFTSLLYSN